MLLGAGQLLMSFQGLELWLSADYDAMSLEYGVYEQED